MPPVNCGLCAKFIGNEDLVQVCGDSKHGYHTQCLKKHLGVISLSSVRLHAGLCTSCKKLPSDVSNQPPSSSGDSIATIIAELRKTNLQNTAIENKLDRLTALPEKLDDCLQKINTLATEHAELASKVDNLCKLNSELTGTVRVLKTENEQLKQKCQNLEERLASCVADSVQTSSATKQLQLQVRHLVAESHCGDLLISGFPEVEGESPSQIALSTCATLKVPLSSTDILEAYRVRSNATVANDAAEKPRTLFVRFRTRALCSNILATKRKFGILQASVISASLPDRRIFINKFLPSDMYSLLLKVKAAAKSTGHKCVWADKDVIKVKSASDTPIIVIRTADDISKLM